MEECVQVLLGLGSNLPSEELSPRENLVRARGIMRRIHVEEAGPFRASSLYQSSPVDCPPDSPPFVNAVLMLMTDLAPEELLSRAQELERRFGRREKRALNEARPLDIDLLVYGELVLASPRLTVPHPRLVSRRFVLQPLCEIAPKLVLPHTSKSVQDHHQALTEDEPPLVRLAHPEEWRPKGAPSTMEANETT